MSTENLRITTIDHVTDNVMVSLASARYSCCDTCLRQYSAGVLIRFPIGSQFTVLECGSIICLRHILINNGLI